MNLTTLINKVGFNFRKASPYIFFGSGAISFGFAIAATIKASRRLDPILDEHKALREEIEEIKAETIAAKDPETPIGAKVVENTELEAKKAIRSLYLQTGGRLVRLYAPTMALGALSLGSFTASVGILRGRYTMAVSGLYAVTEAFDKYRANVIEDLGEEKDYEYFTGLKREKTTLEVTDSETGKTKKQKKDVLTGKPNGLFVYEWKKFDGESCEGSTQWDPSNAYNAAYIQGILNTFQNRVDAGSTVYLDRVLDELGFIEDDKNDPDRKKKRLAEHMAGWCPGDVITCGLEDVQNVPILQNYEFINGGSPDAVLCFNARTDVFNVNGGKV